MQTVNFRCGNCGQLLAVLAQYLGQQVRCPHCQKVVVAPTSLPAAPSPTATATMPPSLPPAPSPLQLPAPMLPPPESAFDYKMPDEQESIFTAPTAADDVFGQSAAKIEMPTDVMAPEPPPPLAPSPLELNALGEIPPTFPPVQGAATLAYAPPPETTDRLSPTGQELTATRTPLPLPWEKADAPTSMATAPAADHEPAPLFERQSTAASLAPPRRRRNPLFDILFFSLVSYSIGTTVLIVVQYIKGRAAIPPTPIHPLEVMPDLNGEHPTRGKKEPFSAPKPKTSLDLPSSLRVALGNTLQLGELEITPLRVERGKVLVGEKDAEKPEPSGTDSLKLFLRLKNVSPDLSFRPLDRYFTRWWNANKDRPDRKFRDPDEPYTYLQVGQRKFYGGPAGYYDERGVRPKDRGNWANEYVAGQNLDRELKPGEEMETFLCTDPDDLGILPALKRHEGGTVTWRVQVRRGSVLVKDRRIPATTVIGVQFGTSEVKDEKPAG